MWLDNGQWSEKNGSIGSRDTVKGKLRHADGPLAKPEKGNPDPSRGPVFAGIFVGRLYDQAALPGSADGVCWLAAVGCAGLDRGMARYNSDVRDRSARK